MVLTGSHCHHSSLKPRSNTALLCSESNKTLLPPLPTTATHSTHAISFRHLTLPSQHHLLQRPPNTAFCSQTLLGLRPVHLRQDRCAWNTPPLLSTARTPTHTSESTPTVFFPTSIYLFFQVLGHTFLCVPISPSFITLAGPYHVLVQSLSHAGIKILENRPLPLEASS